MVKEPEFYRDEHAGINLWRCRGKCRRWKTQYSFSLRARNASGLDSVCKACRIEEKNARKGKSGVVSP
jgi:hypothetical protein